MKNSTKWLLAAALVLLASLTAYNMALRSEYRKGTYKDPLREYTTLAFKSFTEVAVPAAGVVSVRIVPGPFSVRLSPQAARFVHLSQQGGRLSVTAAFPEQVENLGRGAAVVISCPRLARLSTDATYQVQGQAHRNNRPVWLGNCQVLVQGFAQDSLTLHAEADSGIELSDNHLGYLRAVAGTSPGSHPTLQLNSGNRIEAASLTLENQSVLLLNDVVIPQLRYQFADSARAMLTGAALRQLRP